MAELKNHDKAQRVVNAVRAIGDAPDDPYSVTMELINAIAWLAWFTTQQPKVALAAVRDRIQVLIDTMPDEIANGRGVPRA